MVEIYESGFSFPPEAEAPKEPASGPGKAGAKASDELTDAGKEKPGGKPKRRRRSKKKGTPNVEAGQKKPKGGQEPKKVAPGPASKSGQGPKKVAPGPAASSAAAMRESADSGEASLGLDPDETGDDENPKVKAPAADLSGSGSGSASGKELNLAPTAGSADKDASDKDASEKDASEKDASDKDAVHSNRILSICVTFQSLLPTQQSARVSKTCPGSMAVNVCS
jgi:hypothetical protein